MMHPSHTHPAKAPFSCIDMQAEAGGRMLFAKLGVSLQEGAICVISGENGCGKTTLLRQMAGLSAHHGHITWFDKPVRSIRDYDSDALYIGDRHGLYPELTVAQQLEYFVKLWGDTLRMDATVRYLECEPYLHTPISALSAGWTRRVALARLLLIPALIWFLDEPLMHLDDYAALLLGGMIQSHSERGGITVLTMPSFDGPPTLYDKPLSIIKLADFQAIDEEEII